MIERLRGFPYFVWPREGGGRAFILVYPFGRNIIWVTLLPSLLRLYNVHEEWHAQARSQ